MPNRLNGNGEGGKRTVHDVTMPIFNGMWRYRAGWESSIRTLSDTEAGDPSTVYRFDLCSHAGTYIETSQHKLRTERPLSQLQPTDFFRTCKLLILPEKRPSEAVRREEVQHALCAAGIDVAAGDSLLLSVGWGKQHRESHYVNGSPYFTEDLVAWLCERRLHLLGVDVPAIDNQRSPYGAVTKLFEAEPGTLLLAPLVIDSRQVATGHYTLLAAPLKIDAVSASLCRVLLIDELSETGGQIAL